MTFRAHTFFICLLTISLSVVLSGCKLYSLKGYSIDPDVSTYYVGQFKITAYNAPATINQTFAEALKDKISRESRLKYEDENPDLEFNGTIQNFDVTPVAPQPDERTSFNRLTITVNIEYENRKDPKDHWTRSFSHFEDFSTDENLLDVQDKLIETIFKQILEDIFNHAFNNW